MCTELFSHVGELRVDFGGEGEDEVGMIVCTSEDGGSGGGTDGVGDVAVVEEHTVFGDTVEVGGMVETVTIGGNGSDRMVVAEEGQVLRPMGMDYSRHDEENVRS